FWRMKVQDKGACLLRFWGWFSWLAYTHLSLCACRVLNQSQTMISYVFDETITLQKYKLTSTN
ncbi:hypothetical protein, partial [Microcystis aeruginosa]|uniref:hypothetical protein n=1 Tax=Microcystis aeruginosa TaxID=1126 RepID=UPI001C4037CC